MKLHVPRRTCLICRANKTKDEMVRFIFSEEGRRVEDEKKILPGRGYYACIGECRAKWLHRAAKGKARGKRGGHER